MRVQSELPERPWRAPTLNESAVVFGPPQLPSVHAALTDLRGAGTSAKNQVLLGARKYNALKTQGHLAADPIVLPRQCLVGRLCGLVCAHAHASLPLVDTRISIVDCGPLCTPASCVRCPLAWALALAVQALLARRDELLAPGKRRFLLLRPRTRLVTVTAVEESASLAAHPIARPWNGDGPFRDGDPGDPRASDGGGGRQPAMAAAHAGGSGGGSRLLVTFVEDMGPGLPAAVPETKPDEWFRANARRAMR